MRLRISLLFLFAVFFNVTSTFAQQPRPCLAVSHLRFEQLAQIVQGRKILVYAEADENSEVLGEYTSYPVFYLGSGPVCTTPRPWWAISYNGKLAWISETDGDSYNFVPYVMPTPSGVFPTSTTTLDPHIISIDNAAQLVEQVRLGSGWILDADWSPDGKTLAVATSLGVSLYDVSQPDDGTVPSQLLTATVQINEVAFNPDGSLLAAAGEDGVLYVWNAQTRQLVYSLDFGIGFKTIAFSPDGKWLAVSGVGKFAEQKGHNFGTWLLEAQTGTKQSFLKDQEYALHIAFSDDSKRLILDNRSFSTVYDLDSANKLVSEKDYGLDSISGWSLSHNGKQVAVLQSYCGDGGCSQHLTILDTSSHNALIDKSVSDESDINGLLFTPKADLLLSVDRLGELTARLPQTLQKKAVITGHAEVIIFSADKSLMATGGVSGDVRIFTTPSLDADGKVQFKQLSVLYGVVGAVKSIMFNPDQTRIAAIGVDNSLRIWDIQSAKALAIYRNFTPPLKTLAISPDETLLATGTEDHLYVWDIQTHKQLKTFKSRSYQMAFSPDNTQLAARTSYTLELWNIKQETHLSLKQNDLYNGGKMIFLPDNQLLSAGFGAPYRVRFINISSSGNINLRTDIGIPNTENLNRLEISGDGNILAVGDFYSTTIYDANSHKQIQQFTDFGSNVNLSHDGHISLVIKSVGFGQSSTSTITLWDTFTGTLIAETDTPFNPPPVNPIPQSRNQWQDMKLSYDGRLVAMAYYDQSIRLWDLVANREVAILKGHSGPVSRIEFSPDGTKLYSASEDGTIRQWGLPT